MLSYNRNHHHPHTHPHTHTHPRSPLLTFSSFRVGSLWNRRSLFVLSVSGVLILIIIFLLAATVYIRTRVIQTHLEEPHTTTGPGRHTNRESDSTHQTHNTNTVLPSDPHDSEPHFHVLDTAHGHLHEVLSPQQEAAINDIEEKEKADLVQCHQLSSTYDIHPGSSWGRADAAIQEIWHKLECDGLLGLEEYSRYIVLHPELNQPIVIPESRSTPETKETEHDVIALCVCTTTRKITVTQLGDLTLFSSLLPSIDDAWFTDNHLSEMQRWFDSQIQSPLLSRAHSPIHTRLILTPYNNTLHKPGPAFNYITHLAYKDGAQYIYRINDDTFFQTQWATAMVQTLNAMGSPYGVVGPLCREGNVAILTHDFTHRTHHDIFHHHYPPVLSDWWMDDWISRVYGKTRTRRLDSVVVKHMVFQHGTRYVVDHSHAQLLGAEVERGRQQIERWMKLQGSMQTQLAAYQHDEFHFHIT